MFNRVRGFEAAIKTHDEIGNTVYWDAKIPVRATKNSAGYDFYAAEDTVVPSVWKQIFGAKNSASEDEAKGIMKPTLVHTGIKAYMMEDEVLSIYNRSSGPKKLGLIMANSVGIIDSDYYGNPDTDGEIMFAYYNILPFDVVLKAGSAIGQGVFSKFLKTDNDNASGTRMSGFGSTDGNRMNMGAVGTIGAGAAGVSGAGQEIMQKAQGFADKAGKFLNRFGNALETGINAATAQMQQTSENGMTPESNNQMGGFDLGYKNDLNNTFGSGFGTEQPIEEQKSEFKGTESKKIDLSK